MLTQLRRERGQELVEYALILPVLMLLILGTMQFALIVFSYNTIAEAARAGARYAVIGDLADHPDLIRAAVFRVTDTAGLARAQLTVPNPVKQADNTIRVSVTYQMRLFVPFFRIRSITLNAVSTKLIELG